MKSVRTHIFCYDDYRAYSDEVRKSLASIPRCLVMSFLTTEDLLSRIEKDKGRQFCKIAIIGLHENREHFEMVEALNAEIKKRDPSTGLILLCPPDKTDEIKRSVRFNIEAYIPKNANYILRISNTVKKFVAEHSIAILKRRRNYSLYAVLIVILLSLLSVLFSELV
jgi:hypothetical protein